MVDNLATIKFPASMRDSDREKVAEAWDEFRGSLFSRIRAPLENGCRHVDALRSFAIACSDPKTGQLAVGSIMEMAQEDFVLQQHALFHWDVLFHQIDTSFTSGTRYATDTTNLKWRQTVSRRATEDTVNLAVRVMKAFMEWKNIAADPTVITDAYRTLCHDSSHFFDVATKFKDCLYNDISDPERGEFLAPQEITITQGDSLSVWDSRLLRLTWFDPSGDFNRVESVDLAAISAAIAPPLYPG